MRKGQLTVFILMGLIALFAVGFLLYITQVEDPTRNYQSLEDVETAFRDCSTNTFIDLLATIGKQGGYINLQDPVPDLQTSYWYNARKNLQTLEQLKVDMENTLESTIPTACASLNDVFFEHGITIRTNRPQISIALNEQDVTATINYSIEAIQVEQITTIDAFAISENIKLREAISHAQTITNGFEETGMVPLQCHTANTRVYPYNGDIIVHTENLGTLSDETKPYQFWFALKP